MPVNTSGFSRSQPSGDSSIRDGDDLLRSDKSILENVLNLEHEFAPQNSASSASGGIHKQGSARAYMAARSSVATPSSADSAGKIAVTTDGNALIVMNASSMSTIVGGNFPYGAILTNPATQVFTTGAGSLLSGSVTQYDVGGFATSVNTFTIPSNLSGLYQITANVVFPSVVTVSSRQISIRRDGTVIAGATSNATDGNSALDSLSVTVLDSPSAASKYDVFVSHNAGVSLTVSSARFSIHKVI